MKQAWKSLTVMLAMGAAALAGAPAAFADAGAQGAAVGSPGVLSGNVIQIPVHVPVNVCGNTVSVIGILNPGFGNRCFNGGREQMGWDHRGIHRPMPEEDRQR
ncbi:chaplin [Streptomyces sp. NPDC001691]|uniref:chaplin n=1 Tax=Streptomyces sp. NPDC001691 TaxID=3364600 RepID=UPI0036B48CB5